MASIQSVSDEQTEDGAYSSASQGLSFLITQVFWPYISGVVKFSKILSHMPCIKGRARIMRAETSGADNVPQMFKQELEESDDPGKYQAFKQALKEAGYHLIVKALDDEPTITFQQVEHEKLLQEVFSSPMQDKLDPLGLTQILVEKDIVSLEDEEQIRRLEEKEGKASAVFYLLHVIPHRSKEWYETFLQVLLEQGYKKLVNEIDPKLYNKLTNGRSESNDTGSHQDVLMPTTFRDPSTSENDQYVQDTASGASISNEPLPLLGPRLQSVAMQPENIELTLLNKILSVVQKVESNQVELLRRMQELENKVDSLKVNKEQ